MRRWLQLHVFRRRPRLAPVLALVMAGGAAPLVAQDPDSIPEPREPIQGADTVHREPPAAPPAPAYVHPRFALSLTVGTFGFGALQSQPVLVRRRDLAGVALDSARLTRSAEAEGGFQVGASGVLGLGPIWAIRLGAALGRTTIRARYDGDDGDAVFHAAARRLAAGEESDATVLTGEAALRMRLPSSRRAQPYVEIGASAMQWKTGGAPPGAPELGEGVRRFGGMAGIGVDVPFSDRLSARAQATSRVFRTPLGPRPAGAEGAASSTLLVSFEPPSADLFADESRELATALRFELGVSLGLGGAVKAPTDPVEPAGSPSPNGR